MKRTNLLRFAVIIILVLLIILLLRNCGSGSTTERAENFQIDQSYLSVPPEATFIGVFNTLKVLQGIEFNELRSTTEYIQKLQGYYNQNPPFTRVFSDPKGVGIDINKKSVFYISVGTAADEVYTNTIFSLSNMELFENAISKSGKGGYKKSKNFKYLHVDQVSSVAWNDKFVSFISTDPSYDKMEIFDRCFTNTKTKYFDKNRKFSEYIFSSNADFAYWIDCSSYSKNQLHATGKPGEISSLLLGGNIIYGDANFKEGEIDANVKFEFNTILNAAQNKLFKDGFDSKILEIVPNEIPSFLLNTSLNLEGIFSLILSDIDMKLEARNSLASYGLTLDDLTEALEGDVIFLAYPSSIPGKSSTIFGVKIKKKEHFDVLLQVWLDLDHVELERNNIYKIKKGVPPLFPIAATYPDLLQRLFVTDDYVYVSLDESVIDHLTSRVNSSELVAKLKLKENDEDILFSGFVDSRMTDFNDVTKAYNLEEVKFNYENQNFEINLRFKNRNINPLKQIFSLK